MGDSAHAQLVVLVLKMSWASLILAGLVDADSGPLGSERSLRFDALAKNR